MAIACYKKGESVPNYIRVPFDIIISFLLITSGWFWIAGIYIFTALIEHNMYEGTIKFNNIKVKDMEEE